MGLLVLTQGCQAGLERNLSMCVATCPRWWWTSSLHLGFDWLQIFTLARLQRLLIHTFWPGRWWCHFFWEKLPKAIMSDSYDKAGEHLLFLAIFFRWFWSVLHSLCKMWTLVAIVRIWTSSWCCRVCRLTISSRISPVWQVQENAEVARNVMRLELVYEVRRSEFNSN